MPFSWAKEPTTATESVVFSAVSPVPELSAAAPSGPRRHVPGSKVPKYHYPKDRHEVHLPLAGQRAKQQHLFRPEDGTWTPRRNPPGQRGGRKGRRHRHQHQNGPAKSSGNCPPCPIDRTVVAPKARDSVLMEALTDAAGRPMETVSGPRPGDELPEGQHQVAVRLPGRSRICRFTYNVAVRRCQALGSAMTTGPDRMRFGQITPTARCTTGTAWGSRCHFRCTDAEQQLVGPAWVECGPDLRWSGRPPVCYERRSCPVPNPPEHGLLNCRTPDVGDSDSDDAPDNNEVQRMPEGSECNITCREGLRLDLRPKIHPLVTSAAMRCRAGRWNVTLPGRCVLPDDLDINMYEDLDGHIPDVLSDSAVMSNSLGNEACLPNPCLGGGTCLQGPPHFAAVCICPPGIEGERCERAVCGLRCLHGGRCLVVRGTPSCYCRTGYTGQRCQTVVRHVRYPQPHQVRTAEQAKESS